MMRTILKSKWNFMFVKWILALSISQMTMLSISMVGLDSKPQSSESKTNNTSDLTQANFTSRFWLYNKLMLDHLCCVLNWFQFHAERTCTNCNQEFGSLQLVEHSY